MAQIFRNLSTNLGVVGEFLRFLWARRLWWLIPMVVVLLMFAFLLIASTSTGVAPFIYTLF